MARRSSHDRSSRPPGNQHGRSPAPRNAPREPQIDERHDEPSQYPAAPASKEMTSLMVRQRTQLGSSASESIPVIHVRNRTRHPILYRKQLARIEDARPGDLVAVYTDGHQEPLGYGLFNPRSEMSVRMLWNTPEFPTEAAWSEKLRAAISLRRDLLKLESQSDAWRVVHSESDGLSGIVIDRFGDVLSAETFGLGMYQRASLLMSMLAAQMGLQHWLVRTSPQFLSQEGCDPPPLMSAGCPSQVVISEHGTRFRVRFEGGHKTGFFCDQRENRKKLAEFCQGKSVLDLLLHGKFFRTGESICKADDVTGVDLDEEPLKLARENANLNQARASSCRRMRSATCVRC
ncbi:MAG: class I SAM-dependent methyltransferase [Planctomycetaceae bacterium]